MLRQVSFAAWSYTGGGTPINTAASLGNADQPWIALQGNNVFVAYDDFHSNEPAVEAARRVPVKHLKIDPLPAALDSDGGKPGHQPPSDPLSARRLGDKKIFKIHPGSAKPSREPGVEQAKPAGSPSRKASSASNCRSGPKP